MIFAHPLALLLLAVPVLLALGDLWGGVGARVRVPIDHGGGPRRRGWTRGLFTAAQLPRLLLALAIVLLAGPQRVGTPRDERLVSNIEICLDVSGSMSARMPGGGGTRYESAMKAIELFTDRRKGDACGLTIFGGETIRWTPLTKDLDAIRHATPFLDPSKMPRHMNSTRIAGALRACLSTLAQQEEGDRLVVLVSDGYSSDLGGSEARAVGEELEDARITLYAVHIGGGSAPAQLYEVVGPTGGEVFAADDERALERVFAHIDAMQPARVKRADPHPVDDRGRWALAGLALLGAHLLASLILRPTPW